jgi:hypothetical protein
LSLARFDVRGGNTGGITATSVLVCISNAEVAAVCVIGTSAVAEAGRGVGAGFPNGSDAGLILTCFPPLPPDPQRADGWGVGASFLLSPA